ncbi:MAG: bis(5'-nucleosyl)-tetraphosphatase (symmetrical) YqeK [Coriobacteriales bacterium]|jgi:predicted HD superfamily hydrolase involved in NAD metabolism|nr:bis(5'-nucleosyl)-tetraphosphatase (symmetrical) YqeK [Coriobacteriales bacterium]
MQRPDNNNKGAPLPGQNAQNAPQSLGEIYDDARVKLEGRLTQYRLLHSLSVADIADLMANVYEVDPEYARLAGLLHDWDKNYTDEELVGRAERFNIELPDDPRNMAALLHAQTGACAVAQEYPNVPPEILQAISRHTSAATDMSELDMIIYVADMIEPLRSAPSLQLLRSLAGNVPLEELFIKCFQSTLEHLIRRHRYIHPGSVAVWNAYAAKEHAQKRKG